MKVFLMYRDRDFDSAQLLSRRERDLRYRNADHKALRLEQILPWNEEALRQDLGLDVIFEAMSLGDKFLFEAAKVTLLSSMTDLETILYRQTVLLDSMRNEQLVRDIYRIAIDAIEGERKNYWSSFGRYPASTLHRGVEVLQLFFGFLKKLRRLADQHANKFESEGFSRLFSMLKSELSDEYFLEIETHLDRLKFPRGVLISAELGKGNKGTNYVLRKPHEDGRGWMSRLFVRKPEAYTYQLHPRDEAGARALSELNDRGVNLVANALAQSTDHILSFFRTMRTELAFYVGCLNLLARLRDLGEPVCFPVPHPAGERRLKFSGLYDLALALSKGRKVVGNDVDADQKSLMIITGANTGGKSTFLRSVGLAHLMMQAGMFVAADSFSAEICDGIFTHYRREEDSTMESGKWDEELGRMSDIVDHLRKNALVLFNESFASTNEREGSEIARQITKALLDKGVKVFFVTHLYHFAKDFLGERGKSVIFMRAERLPDGTRPFKLVEADPLETSYGEDLYRSIFADREHNRRHRTQATIQ
ncbi:MAG: DNA mismatch repair protein MutS [Pseudolabrys sp.]|nr:DNA mismatch repair protein MutS [Pseudolabrys sp.]